jgi:hypothetical protein
MLLRKPTTRGPRKQTHFGHDSSVIGVDDEHRVAESQPRKDRRVEISQRGSVSLRRGRSTRSQVMPTTCAGCGADRSAIGPAVASTGTADQIPLLSGSCRVPDSLACRRDLRRVLPGKRTGDPRDCNRGSNRRLETDQSGLAAAGRSLGSSSRVPASGAASAGGWHAGNSSDDDCDAGTVAR